MVTNARPLLNLVRVAVDGGHHRAGDAASDAAVVQAAVLPRVGRPATLARRLSRGRPLLRLGRLRRHLAVRWIDDQPRAAVGRVVVLEPVHRARRARELAQRRRALDGLLLTLLHNPGQLRRRDVLEPAAGELVRPLERNAALVAVVVRSGNIGIAPWRLRRHVGSARWQGGDFFARRHFARLHRLCALRRLCGSDASTDENTQGCDDDE